MLLAEVSCHTWLVPAGRKLVRLMVAIALAVSCLLITISVSAPSEVRVAPKVETVSGFGPLALILVSPKVELLPS